MPVIYRQKGHRKLTKKQQQAKLQRDAAYEIAVQNLSTAFYAKKHNGGVTSQEETAYEQAKAGLWNGYRNWAIANDLYEIVTVEQQLSEAMDSLNDQLDKVNDIRDELGLTLLELK